MKPADDERHEDMAATSDSIQEDARRIDRLEAEKRGLQPDDPRADALSREVELLADRVHRKARIQRALYDEEPASGDPQGRSRTN